jgi:hypothetical protein
MIQNIAYQQSIAAEFHAIKDRVRYFIGNHHWGEDGRYKEVILMNFLRKILPQNVGIGTGFIKNENNELTSQIDVIIYQRNYPVLFSEGDFVIIPPESVIGIIEVKSKSSFITLSKKSNSLSNPSSPLEKNNRNGRIIGNTEIFNGIFSYDTSKDIIDSIKMRTFEVRMNASSAFIEQFNTYPCYINHICLGEDILCKYWESGNPQDFDNDNHPCYSFYNLSSGKVLKRNGHGLAFGYFFSNLLEIVYRFTNPCVLSKQYFEYLYPIENGKENYRILNYKIQINQSRNFPARP